MSEQRITIWEAKNNLDYRDYIEPDDPMFVDLTEVRGDYQLYANLYDKLGMDEDGVLHNPPKTKYIIFTGHIGCGKSTELARIDEYLDDIERYCVVRLDCLKQLDINNLKYSDVLLGLAKNLLERLEKERVRIDKVHLSKLEDWFKERVISHANLQRYEADLTAGTKVEATIPFLATLFASLTTSVHNSTTYREDVREVVRNTYSQLIAIFNDLTEAAESELNRRLVFSIDGTDRLDGDDSVNFFIEDINQLTQICGIFIYCAPIHLLHSHNTMLLARFDEVVRLPMLKVRDRDNQPIMDNFGVIRDMVYRRLPSYFFESEAMLDELITYSGGHLRDLLRLLNNVCSYRNGENDKIDAHAVERAIDAFATEYERMLKSSDYQFLVQVDNNPDKKNEYAGEQSNRMLQHLVLLEYNSFFWKSHPVITRLAGYQTAEADYHAAKQAEIAAQQAEIAFQNSWRGKLARLLKPSSKYADNS